jgi:hypothetical protein
MVLIPSELLEGPIRRALDGERAATELVVPAEELRNTLEQRSE